MSAVGPHILQNSAVKFNLRSPENSFGNKKKFSMEFHVSHGMTPFTYFPSGEMKTLN
jgi:hypothetical protein